jgi:hypothetical protein
VEKAKREGIQAEVIDLRSLEPLDIDTVLTSVKRPAAWWKWMRTISGAGWGRDRLPGSGEDLPLSESALCKLHNIAFMHKSYTAMLIVQSPLDGCAHEPFCSFD